jgi:hypothetical protein
MPDTKSKKEREREASQSLAYEHQSFFIPSSWFFVSPFLSADRDEMMGHLHTDCGIGERQKTWSQGNTGRD